MQVCCIRFTDYSECYVRRAFLLIIVNAELAEDSCTTDYSERLLLCSPLSALPRCGSVALRLAIKHDAASGLNSTDYSECLSRIQEAALTRIESLLTTVNVWGRCHDVHHSGDAILCFTVYSERCSKALRDDLRYPCSLSSVQRMTFQENLRLHPFAFIPYPSCALREDGTNLQLRSADYSECFTKSAR